MDIVDELNSIVVSPEELFELIDEANALNQEGRAEPGGGLYLVANRYRGDWKRAFAVYTRLELLAKIVESDKSKGWVFPKLPNGAIPTKEELITVAATHPLTKKGDQIDFDEHSFFAKVMVITEAKGNT